MIKPIELTEKHLRMLKEMCVQLFPEYEYHFVNFQNISFAKKTRKVKEMEQFVGMTEGIHWFEFCMNDLAGKIYNTLFTNKQSENWFGSHYNWVCWALNTKKPYKIHIIDYLYEQFIKIKNNDNKKEKK